METILEDVKRAMRPLLGMVHAVSGALGWSGVGSDVHRAGRYRAIGGSCFMRDVYGREGMVDIYSGREMVKFYRAMAFGKEPLR